MCSVKNGFYNYFKPITYQRKHKIMEISKLISYNITRVGAFTKFVLFIIFTLAYIYIAIQSMPSKKRTTSTKNKNITSKIISHIEESKIDPYAMEEEMALRREQVFAACQKVDTRNSLPNTMEFVVDAHHSLVWCKIFKAASSTWINYFNLLGGYEDSFLKKTQIKPITLLRSCFPSPTLPQLATSLHTSLSFIIVRDPLERLLSIYKYIIESVNNNYCQQLLKRIRKQFNGMSLVKKRNPTFKEFVKYVINHTSIEELWVPIYKSCSPCTVNFTAIAKLETLKEDQEFIIKRAGVEDILNLSEVKLQNVAHGIGETKELIQNYYSELDHDLLMELIKIYQLDYEMFGYNVSKYVSYTTRHQS